jgi:hypothetical protein
MAVDGIGPLVAADETLNHQIVDTFGTVRESDRSWTEKLWLSLARKDGALQIDFGLGRYQNRGIMDGFGGVSRGREQWTVRGSRELRGDPATAVGPVAYEVLEPLNSVRVRLAESDVLDVSFDLVFTGALPPFLEGRNEFRDATGRIASDVIRYHQSGSVSGWVSAGGERHEVTPGEWFGFRDHSWGVRGDAVGVPPTDVPAVTPGVSSGRGFMHWTPWLLTRPDGTAYEIQQFIMEASGARVVDTAFLNTPDGRQRRIRGVQPEVRYDPVTRFLAGGEVHLELDSGDKRTVQVEPVGDSGFFLRTGGYGFWEGHRHGTWHGGPLHVDGEYISDCWAPDTLRKLGQLRDRPVRLRDGDAEGYGIFESIIIGVWPELALGEDSDYGGY